MKSYDLLNSIYDDFFKVEKKEVIDETTDKNDFDMKSIFNSIDNLYLSDESKELFKKIIEYMRKYNEKIEDNYIPIRLAIESNDKKTIDSIQNIILDCCKYYNYIDNNNISKYSFFHVEKDIVINNSKDIIVLDELTGFAYLDESVKKRVLADLDNVLFEKNNIVILVGREDELKSFYMENGKLEEIFSFVFKYEKPGIQDIYQDIINKSKLDEEKQILLLDYITATYKDIDNIDEYKDRLLKEIIFNGLVPTVEREKTLEEIFKELNELVGLDTIKKTIYDLVDFIELRKKTQGELKINNVNLHMVFLGNPGTGKTTVARLIKDIFYNLKLIKKSKLLEVSSKDLVAEYVGQTAPKTNAVINKALDGVLFIDEAYSLAVKNDNSFNAEAIATLIQGMENHRDDLVVIFAGYTKEMQDFLNSNSGIVSRIGYTLDFPDYTEDELSKIFVNMMEKAGFIVKDEVLDHLKELIRIHKNNENFGNARFIRNVYEKTIIKHATNTKNNKRKDILKTITRKDIEGIDI